MIMEMFGSKKRRKLALDAGSLLNASVRDEPRGDDTNLTLVPEELFRKMLSIERKRTERSRQRFVLMLLHLGRVLQDKEGKIILTGITKALSASIRETDLHGWYNDGSVVGVICTEIGAGEVGSILSALRSRVGGAIRKKLELAQMNEIHISFYVFPDDFGVEQGVSSADSSLHPDLKPFWSIN